MTINIQITNNDAEEQKGNRIIRVAHPNGLDYVHPGETLNCHLWGKEKIEIIEIENCFE